MNMQSGALRPASAIGALMLQYWGLLKALKSGLGKTSLVVFSGSLVSAACGFLVSVLIAKQFGPENFGLISAFFAFMNMCIQLSDFGTGKAIVRLSSGAADYGVTREEVYSGALVFRLLSSALFAALVFFGAGFIVTGLLNRPELGPYMKLASAGILAGGIGQTFLSMLQEKESFGPYSANKIATALFKLSLILLFAFTAGLTVGNVIWITIASLLAGAVYAYMKLPKRMFDIRKAGARSFRKLFSYSQWVTVIQVCSILIMNIPVLMLTRYSEPSEVGFYSAAATILMGFSLLAESLLVVLLPRFSKIEDIGEIRRLNNKVTGILALVSLPPLALLFFSSDLMVLFFGPEYAGSGTVFKVLLAFYLVNLAATSYTAVSYRVRKIHYFSLSVLLKLVLLAVFGLLFVRAYGAVGIAWAVLISGLTESALKVAIVRNGLREGA